MLRALALTCLVLVAAPASAAESPDAARVQAPETSAAGPSNALAQGQDNKAPPQAPKRDCERKQEGVSA